VAKKPYPGRHESDTVANGRGFVTRGECRARGIYADETSVVEICVEVACCPDSHAEVNVSHIAAGEEAGTESATMDGGGVERLAAASHGARGFCCAFRGVSYPPHAF
jgi:hypothetical protein